MMRVSESFVFAATKRALGTICRESKLRCFLIESLRDLNTGAHLYIIDILQLNYF